MDLAAYPYQVAISTRWMDNDVYGHINNVQYYSFFDTVVNRYLIEEGGLDIQRAEVIGVCVESKCNYARPLAFPQTLTAGLRVEHLSRRSVRYGIAIAAKGETEAAASGHFVHVFVERESMSAVPIPDRLREALERIAVEAS